MEEEGQKSFQEAPETSFPLHPVSVPTPQYHYPRPRLFPCGPHINEILPEPSPQVLDEGSLTGEVLQKHEILYTHPVTGRQGTLHGYPHPVTAQGL